MRRIRLAPPGRLVFMILLGIIVVAGALAVMGPQVSIPMSWVESRLGSLGDEWGVSVQASQATWQGWNRLILHGVELRYEGKPDAGDPQMRLDADRVDIQVFPSDLISLFSPPSHRRVTLSHALISPSLDDVTFDEAASDDVSSGEVDDDTPDAARHFPHWLRTVAAWFDAAPLSLEQAVLHIGDDRVVVQEVRLAGPWGRGRVTARVGRTHVGEADPGETDAGGMDMDVRVAITAADVSDLTVPLGWDEGALGVLSGPATIEIDVDGAMASFPPAAQFSEPVEPVPDPDADPASAWEVRWRLEAESLDWREAPWGSGHYAITGLSADGRWDDAGFVEIHRFIAQARDGEGGDDGRLAGPTVPAGQTGHLRLVEATGTWVPGGGVDLQVHAQGLRLADDLPMLQSWGMAGLADFQGTLDGTMHRLRLSGTVDMGPGLLWHQPVERARASLTWEPGELSIHQSEIEQGASLYEIEGAIAFPAAAEGALDLTVTTQAGRAKTLLDVLGWSDWPLSGTVDGVLRFRGPFGSLESEGQVVLTDGTGWSQPFDEIAASYRWDREALHLDDGVFRWRGGRGAFAGWIGGGGELHLDIDATGFPLESLEAVRRASRGLLAGRIDFQGHVGGALSDPTWEGRVNGRDVQFGRLDFARGGGELAQSRGMWEVRDLVLERASGARYAASGWVNTEPGLPTLVHVLVDVDGEALEEALSLMGVELGYPLASGRVAGRSLLIGELSQPDGEIVLDVKDALLAGRPTGLSVELDVAGGQVRVRRLQLGATAQEQRQGWQEQGQG